GYLGGDLRQTRSVGEPLGPVQVGAEVPVAEVEPVDSAVPADRSHGLPALVAKTPPGLGVDLVGEGVGDGVEVRAYVQPVEVHIVADVGDRGDGSGVDDRAEGVDEAGGAHAAGDDTDRGG